MSNHIQRRSALAALAVAGLAATAARAADDSQAAVTTAVEQLRQLMVDPDRARLEALVADELSYGHSSGKVDTKQSFIRDLLDGTSDFKSITLSEQQLSVLRDVATVRHMLMGETQDAGKPPGTVKLHVLTVWVRQSSGWRLLARQAVRPPA